jgi:hypothetical protein
MTQALSAEQYERLGRPDPYKGAFKSLWAVMENDCVKAAALSWDMAVAR